MLSHYRCLVTRIAFLFCGLFILSNVTFGQVNSSVVNVWGGEVGGYGVAVIGKDQIVTALHVVAGRSPIKVEWQGKTSLATIEKIYMDSDLALLKLKTPLGVPGLKLHSGAPPLDLQVQYWEIPVNSNVVRKNTILQDATSLNRITLGARPVRRCSDCLTVLEDDARFCTKCGARAPENARASSSE